MTDDTRAEALPSWLEASLIALLGLRQSLPHALLIQGPRGIGKGLLARHFAQSLLCESPLPDGRACARCDACGWFAAGNHPDFRQVSPLADEESGGERAERSRSERARPEIKIDQIRALAGFVGVGGHRAGRKPVVIDPADGLNLPAANALLKTLEEPSGETVFLLVAAQGAAVAPTVRSRCVPWAVPAPSADLARAWLGARLGNEQAARAADWLALADGAPLRALALAEPGAAAAHRLLLQAVQEIPETGAMRIAEGFGSQAAPLWVPLLQSWVSDLARVLAGASAQRYPGQQAVLRRLAQRTRLHTVTAFATWLDQQARVSSHPLNARLYAEDLWLRYEALFAR